MLTQQQQGTDTGAKAQATFPVEEQQSGSANTPLERGTQTPKQLWLDPLPQRIQKQGMVLPIMSVVLVLGIILLVLLAVLLLRSGWVLLLVPLA